MWILIYVSLTLNVVVLVPICASMLLKAPWVDAAYGAASPARGIVLSVYVAILLASIYLILRPSPSAIAALLAVQVIYKLTTPFTVGTVSNPVVVSNLFIAAVHLCTLLVLVRD